MYNRGMGEKATLLVRRALCALKPAPREPWKLPRAWVNTALGVKALVVGMTVAIVIPMGLIGYKHSYLFTGMPNFERYDNAQDRKEAFIRYMLPLVHQANADLRRQQHRMLRIYGEYAAGEQPNEVDRAWLLELAQRYEIEGFSLDPAVSAEQRQYAWELMFRRVDTVPVSLVLAQAANESAWGTSRFAQQGYNLFGEWCYTEGCGIVPARRDAGKTHEVRSFTRVYDSLYSYMHNLNTHKSYASFRDMRVDMRRRGELLTGEKLASGLDRYSELGQKYVDIIRTVIQKNGLEQFDGVQAAGKEKGYNKLSS